MNKSYGPALVSCLKQNEKYSFSGLIKTHSVKRSIHPSDFQALARDVSIPWHQIYYAIHISEKHGHGDIALLRWLIIHVLYQSGSGHLRSDLNDFEDALNKWFYLEREFFPGTDREFEENSSNIEQIKDSILQSFNTVIEENQELFGSEDSQTPFVYLKDRKIIYIRKFLKLENQLLSHLAQFSHSPNKNHIDNLTLKINHIVTELNLSRAFPLCEETVTTAEKLIGNKLAILSGGPGTGKTTTVTALLRILKIMEKRGFLPGSIRIKLAAPTGRAANRMIESIRSEMKENPVPEVDNFLPDKAFTLHKLLGINPARKDVLYNKNRPIPADLVILDEASMVDARIMSLLFEALSPFSTLLLVGDKDQLPSVDAGAVFGDLVTNSEVKNHKLHSSVVVLNKSWRSSTGILKVAREVILGHGEIALKYLKEDKQNILYAPIPGADRLVSDIMGKYGIKSFAGPGKRFFQIHKPEAVDTEQLEKVFSAFERFAVLIPSKRGTYGVERINNAINMAISGREQSIYHGQPIMIRTNDYNLSLFNGDRGVFLNFGGEFFALFRNGPDRFRFIPAGKLSSYDTAFAQTIHKSQGSEFNEVLVLIPEGSERLLTREIVYTGITRAREKLTILSSDQVFSDAVSREVIRHSGIREFLGGHSEP